MCVLFSEYLNILGRGFLGYLFYHIAENRAINSFFILQSERTFQQVNVIYQSYLKHRCGFPRVFGWKLKSITNKALPTSPSQYCTISLLILLTLRFYSPSGSFSFQNVPHSFLPQQLCTFCSLFLEHAHVALVYSPFRSQHNCSMEAAQVSFLIYLYIGTNTKKVPSPLLYLTQLCSYIYLCSYF